MLTFILPAPSTRAEGKEPVNVFFVWYLSELCKQELFV